MVVDASMILLAIQVSKSEVSEVRSRKNLA